MIFFMRQASLEPIHFSKELIFDRQDFDNSASLLKKIVRQKLYRRIVGFYGGLHVNSAFIYLIQQNLIIFSAFFILNFEF